MQLNSAQKQAVTQCDSPLLVLAGAGSGKTGVITRKIAWLIEQKQIPARQIVAVTFTNKAAAEMKERLVKVIGKSACRNISISTFHRLGLTMLQRDGSAIGVKRGFTILDQLDSLTAIQSILREANLPHDEKPVRNMISDWKNSVTSPQLAMSAAENDYDLAAAQVYARYDALLQACNSVDFDDLISLPVKLLRDHEEVREKWQTRIRHLLVDEYQDTNACQYELVRLLLGAEGVLTAVGDDDQSIYSWRGANPENLANLQTDFPGLQVIKLEQNYRSSQRILRSANAVIAENPHLFEKRLWSDLGIGDILRLCACHNGVDEAEWVAADILTQQFRFNTQCGDIAILYRSNFQARVFEKALREKHIPYRISGGQSFFDHVEIKDLMSYLKLLVNPDDDSAFLRIINTPKRDIGPKTLEQLGLFATENACSLFNACLDQNLVHCLSPRAFKNVSEFAQWMVLQSDNVNRGDSVAVIRQMINDINYDAWIEDQSATPESADRALANVEELLGWIDRLAEDATEGTPSADNTASEPDVPERNSPFGELVAHMALMDMLSRNDNDGTPDSRVQLMTLHSAKGLEFPQVYMIGMEEGILPHHNSSEDEMALQEERRLAYVGMTRAQHQLTFTWARTRQRFGETFSNEPSRFLDSIAADDLQRLGQVQTAEAREANNETGKATLAGLKALLEAGN